MTELQGVVLAGVVIIAAFYVLPYVYRRRRILSQTPLDDGQSQELRMLNLGDVRAPKDEAYTDSYGDVFTGRNGVVMSNSEKKGTVTIRSLARERAGRRARVAKREANRTRGFIGAILFGILTVGLWLASAILHLPVVLSIIMTVIFGVYAGGFAYMLRQMDKANAIDLDVIETVDAQLKALRKRTRRQLPYRRANDRAGRNGGRGTREEQTHGSGREKLSASTGVTSSASTGSYSRRSETIIDSSALRPLVRNGRVTAHPAPSAVPSYTLKRSQVEQRDIAPYEPPVMPETRVPYRPTKIGERLDVSSVTSAVTPDDVAVVTQPLGGGALLDDILARRRA